MLSISLSVPCCFSGSDEASFRSQICCQNQVNGGIHHPTTAKVAAGCERVLGSDWYCCCSQDIERVIQSIGDGMSYATANTRPVPDHPQMPLPQYHCVSSHLRVVSQVAKMIKYLRTYFDADTEGKYSLAIRNGVLTLLCWLCASDKRTAG